MAEPLDIGPMLALYMRMQQEQLRPAVAPHNTPRQRRRLTGDAVNLFFKLLETLRLDFACEVGAHDGAFSRRVKQTMPEARVIAFEANPIVFDMHRRALEHSGVEFHQMCVADQAGTTQLKVPIRDDAPLQPGEDPGSDPGDSPQQHWPGQGKAVTMGSTLEFSPANRFELFECETVSLDGFLREHSFRRGALWIDVEGAASRVFEGAVQTLAKCVAIYVEVESRTKWTDQKSDAEVYQFLFDHGFIPLLPDLQKSWQYNVILLRKDVISPGIQRTILNFLSEKQSPVQ